MVNIGTAGRYSVGIVSMTQAGGIASVVAQVKDGNGALRPVLMPDGTVQDNPTLIYDLHIHLGTQIASDLIMLRWGAMANDAGGFLQLLSWMQSSGVDVASI